MSATSKKSKTKKISEIKVEKVELQPLGAYANDRVELIRQVFSCLKTKYIKSICPEVLAGQSIQEIQECCLDELLGISKKRLLAILNATECPSDTDSSSDNGSDRDSKKEYISLEEISSDDEINEKNATNTDNKEISVLELLELQARARAIRSQLALEPVTKIELDSDKDDDSNLSSSSSSLSKVIAKPQHDKSKRKVKRPTESASIFADLDNNDANEVTSTQRLAPQPQPIRLKRNFLKRENRPGATVSSDENKEETKADSETVSKSTEAANKIEIASKVNIEKLDKAGSSSPDIITVIQSPETYSITDSEDEKVNDKTECPVTTANEVKATVEISQGQESHGKNEDIPEEGEIVEGIRHKQENIENSTSGEGKSEKLGNPVENKSITLDSEDTSKLNPVDNGKIEIDLTKQHTDHESNTVEPNLTVDLADEELDYELKDDSEVESESEDRSKKIENENAESETIEIYESSEEENSQTTTTNPTTNSTTDLEKSDKDCLSFHERWLGSKKVSKILATSRLGNRLRGNIKSKKAAERAQNLDSPTSEQPTEKQPEPDAMIDYEVDSVEHYKNLVSNSDKNELTEKNDATEKQAIAAEINEVAEENQLVIDEKSG